MSQEHVTVEEIDFGVFEIYPLSKTNKIKFCKMLDRKIGTCYEVEEDYGDFTVVVLDAEKQKEANLIFEFVDKINEKIKNEI